MRQTCLDCNKQPSFHYPDQTKPIYCAEHRKQGMVDLIHPTCLDCDKFPSFNFPDQTKPIYCAAHRKQGMRDVVHTRCLDCEKRPHFNFPNEPRGIYCAEHQKPGMVSIMIPKCLKCNKKPHFNFPGETKGLYCADHKEPRMRNVVSRTCLECHKQPHFNFEGEKRGIYCGDHKWKGMLNVIKPTCLECDKKPHFNFPDQTRGIYCAEHKEPQMRNVVSPTCLECDKLPVFNFPDQKRGVYCYTHKKPQMQNVVDPKCKTPLCDITVTKKYKGYCFRCFLYMFPDETVSRNYKTKEKTVSDFLKTSFPNITMSFDKRIENGCSKRRPDCYIDMGLYTIVVEIDENQHQSYDCSCTNRRMMELFQDSGNRPLYLIRFNPDDYLDCEKNNITSCWGTTKKGICVVKKKKREEWEFRLGYLKECLTSCIEKQPTKEVEVIHLFYDLCLES